MPLSYYACETYYDDKHKTWYGPKEKDYFHPDMTLGEAIVESLKQNHNKVLQVMDCTKEQLTGEELLRNSLKISKTFVNLGLKVGDVVGLFARNTQHITSVVIGTWLTGAVTNAVYDLFDKAELELIYKVTRPKIICCDIENYRSVLEVDTNLKLNAKIYIMNGEVENISSINELLVDYSEEELENYDPPCSTINGEYTAAILCSSGTTGPPKGVTISHKALLNQKVYQTLRHDSVLFSFSTLYWVSGYWSLKEALLCGCLRVVTTQAYTPEYFMDLVKRNKVTHMIASTISMTEIALKMKEEWKKCMKSIDTILCGGSKVPIITYENMNALLADNPDRPGFVVFYGMTELSALLSYNYYLPGLGYKGSDGKLAPNKIVQIRDENGKPLGINEHGEIHIKFHYNWQGYYKNEVAFKNAFKDGWFATGDIGYFNERGFLHICARNKDVYKSFNLHVYPEKIENVVLQIPGVQEVCVFGIPDVKYANVSACAVVRTKDVNGENLTEDLIKKTVSESLPSFYHLYGGVYFFESFPKTGSDKIKRSDIRDIVIKDMDTDF